MSNRKHDLYSLQDLGCLACPRKGHLVLSCHNHTQGTRKQPWRLQLLSQEDFEEVLVVA